MYLSIHVSGSLCIKGLSADSLNTCNYSALYAKITINRIYMLFTHGHSGRNVIFPHGMNILLSAIGKGFHRVYRNYPR